MSGSYFQPVITIQNGNVDDFSGVAGIITELKMPADADRIGWMIQNLSDTNDLWYGYDAGLEIGKAGYMCIKGGDKTVKWSPTHGSWAGDIYIVSDGGGRYTLKSWTQV